MQILGGGNLRVALQLRADGRPLPSCSGQGGGVDFDGNRRLRPFGGSWWPSFGFWRLHKFGPVGRLGVIGRMTGS